MYYQKEERDRHNAEKLSSAIGLDALIGTRFRNKVPIPVELLGFCGAPMVVDYKGIYAAKEGLEKQRIVDLIRYISYLRPPQGTNCWLLLDLFTSSRFLTFFVGFFLTFCVGFFLTFFVGFFLTKVRIFPNKS